MGSQHVLGPWHLPGHPSGLPGDCVLRQRRVTCPARGDMQRNGGHHLRPWAQRLTGRGCSQLWGVTRCHVAWKLLSPGLLPQAGCSR